MPNPRRARHAARALLLAAVVTSVVALVATTLSTPAVAATHSSRVGVTHSKKANAALEPSRPREARAGPGQQGALP